MIRIAHALVSSIRTLAALACMGCGLIETLRLAGPANVPEVGRYTFLALAIAAFAVAICAQVIGLVLPRPNPARPDRRAVEFGAAARPKVVDLALCRRIAARATRRRLWG